MTEPALQPNPSRARMGPGVLAAVLAAAGIGILWLGGVSVEGATVGARGYRETRIEGDAFPKQLIDPLGIRQTIPAPPTRIASTMLLGDELLTELIGTERLVAVSRLIDNPAISNSVHVVPEDVERISPDVETLLRLGPDLVVIAAYSRAESVRLLLSTGIPVLRFGSYETFTDVVQNVRTAGAAVGADARADAIVADMQHRIAAVEARVEGLPRPRVLYYIPGGFTPGRDTLIDEMIRRGGGTNVAHEAGLVGESAISLELAIGLEPDVLLLPSWRPPEEAHDARAFLEDPRWQQVPAVRNGRVYEINYAKVVTLSHHAVEGLEHMAALLHPGAFES